MRELSLFLLLMLLFSGCSTRGKGAYKHEHSLLQKTIPANPEEKIFTPDNKTAISLALYERGSLHMFLVNMVQLSQISTIPTGNRNTHKVEELYTTR